jgi:hypothetical protein
MVPGYLDFGITEQTVKRREVLCLDTWPFLRGHFITWVFSVVRGHCKEAEKDHRRVGIQDSFRPNGLWTLYRLYLDLIAIIGDLPEYVVAHPGQLIADHQMSVR